MPFLDSNTIRALYDIKDGGPPRGFECMYCSCGGCKGKTCSYSTHHYWCEKLTRTLRGMYTHQRIVHGIKEQGVFQFDDIQGSK